MGAYLSAPIKDKETEDGEDDTFRYGVTAMQGWRTDMEDAHSVVLDVDGQTHTGFFGVFDGHGGKEVAKFCAAHLPEKLAGSEAYRSGQLGPALTQTFLAMDEALVDPAARQELSAMRGQEKEDEKPGAPMVINGAQLPDSLLEALGMPSGGGFQIRLVRSGPGGRGITIGDIEEEGAEGSDQPLLEVDLGEGEGEEEEGEEEGEEEDAGEASADDAAADAEAEDSGERNGKRKRDGRPMQVDEGEDTAEGGEVVEPSSEEGAVEAAISTPTEEEYTGPSAGCTAVCAVVRGAQLVVANAGDSRCVLSRRGRAVDMTQDHKPTDPEEYARITKAGGFVTEGRVNGSLNLSRALGDMEYKQSRDLPPEAQMVTAMPEVRSEALQEGDEFLILACDGIWDVLTNQEAVDFVRQRLLAGEGCAQICEEVCDHCLAPDTGGCGKGCDNMSMMVVLLKPFADRELLAPPPAAP